MQASSCGYAGEGLSEPHVVFCSCCILFWKDHHRRTVTTWIEKVSSFLFSQRSVLTTHGYIFRHNTFVASATSLPHPCKRASRLAALAADVGFAPRQRDPPGTAVTNEKVGVLLLNLGGPDKLSDVQPFLYNLFADPEIIRLPPNARFLQPVIAQIISTLRAPKSQEGYKAIGGGEGGQREHGVPLGTNCASIGISL